MCLGILMAVCEHVGMCIQIKATVNQVPKPRNQEGRAGAPEQWSLVGKLCLAGVESTHALEPCGSTNHPGEGSCKSSSCSKHIEHW